MSDTTPAMLPHNIAFEKEVLGAAITNSDALDTVTGGLRSEHFYSEINRVLYDAITDAYANARPIDASLLAREVTRAHSERRLPDQVDAHAYLASVVEARCPEAAVPERIKDIIACSDARGVYEAAQKMAAAALDTDGDPEQVETTLTNATEQLASLTDAMVAQPWLSLDEVVSDASSNESREPLFQTGLLELDRKLNGGLRGGQMVCIAARPAQGKSTLALDIARHASVNEDVPGLLVSLEMSASQVGARFISAQAGIDLSHMMTLTLTPVERERATLAAQHAAGAPLYTVTPPSGHWPTIRSLITAAHRRLGIKYVILDYLQLIDTDGGPANSNREQIVARVSRNCKSMALSMNIAVIVVAQLNRGPENRTGGKPQVSDLRESGQIEQDCDIIALIHQPQSYDPDTARVGEADIIVGKHRDGPTGTVAVAFQGHYSRFANMTHQAEPSE